MVRFNLRNCCSSIGSHVAAGRLAGLALLAAVVAPTGVSARQYVSLLPNYSNTTSNFELDYWTFSHDSEYHPITDLWDAECNAEMIASADFSVCTFRYTKKDKVIEYTPYFTIGDENFEGRMELTLALDENGRSPWNVSRIELYAVNAFDTRYNYKPKFSINGVQASLPEGNERDYVGVDIPEDAGPLTKIVIETPANSRISFWDMKVYLRGVPELPEGFIHRERRVYGEDDTYRFPAVKVGTLDPAAKGKLQCSLLDSEGTVAASSTRLEEGCFAFGAAGIEEGHYKVVYHMPDIANDGTDRCVPAPEDGLDLVVEPTIRGIMLNGFEINDLGHITNQEEGSSLSWKNAEITGLRDGVQAYWKTSRLAQGETAPDTPEITTGIPDDFRPYSAAEGVDMTEANCLHLILTKNGVYSRQYAVQYSLQSVNVKVQSAISDERECRWHTIDGLRVNPADVPRGTLLIRTTPGGRPIKTVK